MSTATSTHRTGQVYDREHRTRMIGPFFAPVTHDWAFGLWVGLTVMRVAGTLLDRGSVWPDTVLGVLAWVTVGSVLTAAWTLLLISITIGVWRGYRVGYREGRQPVGS